MAYQFRKHYTREEAKALLPQIQEWLQQLTHQQQRLEQYEKRLGQLLARGNDLGGGTVNEWVRSMGEMQGVLRKFEEREIQVKDLDRGLIDFPSLIGGREVFLCWEQGEDDIEFWHELDAGYAGRERLL